METIPVKLSDLRRFYKAMDDAASEIEAAVHDGDVDDSILEEMRESLDVMEQMLNERVY